MRRQVVRDHEEDAAPGTRRPPSGPRPRCARSRRRRSGVAIIVWLEVDLGLVQGRLRPGSTAASFGLELGHRAVVVGLGGLEIALRAAASGRPARAPARTSGARPRPRPRERSTLARAAIRLARAWPTRASKSDGSRRATTWPFLTGRVEVGVQVLDRARHLRARPGRWSRPASVPVAPTTSAIVAAVDAAGREADRVGPRPDRRRPDRHEGKRADGRIATRVSHLHPRQS